MGLFMMGVEGTLAAGESNESIMGSLDSSGCNSINLRSLFPESEKASFRSFSFCFANFSARK